MNHPNDIPNELFYSRFSNSTLALSETDIPCRPENRRKTDKSFLFVFVAAIIVLIPFVIYTCCHADVSRLQPSDDFAIAYRNHFDFSKTAWRVTLASFISLGITIILAALFRYATSIVVWGILILSWLYFLAMTVFLWLSDIDNIVPKILFTVITVGLLLILVCMKSRIRLVTMLFSEATKSSFDMRMIFVIPAVSIVLLLIISAALGTTTVLMATAIEGNSQNPDLLPTGFIAVIIINAIIALWVIEFFFGMQYMMVSGSVTKWYFSRNKEILGDPVYTSFYVTLRYHLGTVAFGSLIITLISILRAILRSLAQNSKFRWCLYCCMDYIEGFLRFFTKNSYIVTAMHGTSFVESGKQAVKLLTLNICNTIAISSIGDFVICMCHVLVAGLSLGVTYLLLRDVDQAYAGYCYLFVFGIALVCSFTILGTFETAFSTLFLCVCQDFIINNGAEKPYAMTRNLMEFLDSSKKLFADKIQKKGLPTI